jgi:hypothetical protein
VKRKTWIKVRRGLLEHREKMGIRLWLYLYILDLADWGSGAIEGWTDGMASEDLGMPVDTIREQRRQLASDGYIICQIAPRGQRIVISNWINPREYSGEEYNQGGEFTASGSVEVPTQGGQLSASLPSSHISTSHTQVEANEKRKSLEDHFVAISGLKSPVGIKSRSKEAGEMWWEPLREYLELCDWDLDRAKQAVVQTIKYMRTRPDPWPVNSPKSTIKTARGIIGKMTKSAPVPTERIGRY